MTGITDLGLPLINALSTKVELKVIVWCLVNSVFPGICLTKSEARLLPKRRPFLGWVGGERKVQAHQPIHQVRFSLGSSSHRDFSAVSFWNLLVRCDNYYVSIGSWHGMLCHHNRADILVCAQGSQMFKQPLAAGPLLRPTDHLIYSGGLSPLTSGW